MAVVKQWADAFSSGTFASDNAPCAEDAVVIDDLPPHVWQGPGACSRWYGAFRTWAAKNGAIQAALSLGNTRHLDVDADLAYLVAPVTLSYLKAGQTVKFPGTITLTLRKQNSGWRISGAAWADQ
jgi:ketosteroid isomerase-like protein